MKEYTDKYGEFDTLTVKTPSGGIHYYFLYNTNNKVVNNLIEQIPNATEFYGHGIDVRTEKKKSDNKTTESPGGYVVGPDSEINNKKYTIINDKPISEMPEELAFWLLQGSPNISKSNDDNSKIKKPRTNITRKVIFNPNEI